jgi:hypothetical protein
MFEHCLHVCGSLGLAGSSSPFPRQLRHNKVDDDGRKGYRTSFARSAFLLYLEVKDEKGETTVWALEATGYGGLQRVGIKRDDVKFGDRVRVRCHVLRDGTNGCLLGFVTPLHGDPARGHGVEKDWDGGGGAGFPDATTLPPNPVQQ